MKYELALDLREILKQYCPVDSGALRMSILKVQGTESEYFITIGNNGGKEINGKCATIEYAATTNFAKTLQVYAKGKRNGNTPNYTTISNPNYHWVNNAIAIWAKKNALKLNVAAEEAEEDEEENDIR